MAWDILHTDEFEEWLLAQHSTVQAKIDAHIGLLAEHGPHLRHPYSSGIHGSSHSVMRELRVQVKSDPYRVLYAFDPDRAAVLLLGGNKGGDDRWYDINIPIADRLFDAHLKDLER